MREHSRARANTECVVLDTNAWMADHLLVTRSGVAIIHAIREHEWQLVVPEVIQFELPACIARRAEEHRRKVEKGTRFFEILLKRQFGVALPSAEKIYDAVERRLDELSDIITRIEIDMLHVKSSLCRVIEKLPPSNKNNEQFRDNLVWEVILDMGEKFNKVHFVTRDRDFFEQKKYECGLANNLKEDCTAREINVSIYSDLSQLLAHVGKIVPPEEMSHIFDKNRDLIVESAQDVVSNNVAPMGFSIDGLMEKNLQGFNTDNANILAGNFRLGFALNDNEPDLILGTEYFRIEAKAIVSGSCLIDRTSATTHDIGIESVQVEWISDRTGQSHHVEVLPSIVDNGEADGAS